MKKRNVKFLSLLLVIVMVLGMIPVSVSAATTPATVTVAQAQQRIASLQTMFNGRYFTTTGKACSTESGHGCTSCAVVNVVKQNWFKNLTGFSNLDCNLFPSFYTNNSGGRMVLGYSCVGFACFAQWYIFSQKSTDDVYRSSAPVFYGKFNKTNIANYARPGDVIWFSKGHAVIYISYDNSGINVLDCNLVKRTDTNGNNTCYVTTHKIAFSGEYYSGDTMTISGAKNYNRTLTVPVTGVSLSTTTLSMVVGDTKSVTATVSPSNATDKTVTWSSNNTSVATVSTSGVIKGVSQGTATITAKTKDGGYTARVTVTVEPDTYDVSFWLIGGQWSYGDTFIVEQGDYFYIPNEIPVRDGHIFMYWENIMSSYDNDIYYPGNYYTDNTDAIFMAIWEKQIGWYWQDGYWYYGTEDGNHVGWLYDGGTWYYLNADGTMATGWVLDRSTWYYMNASGAMMTGWVYDGSAWYYMNGSGAMMIGWVYDGSAWYYMNASGAMMTGWVYDGSAWYYMNGSGAMMTGWVYDGAWYYMNSSGAMQTGWVLDGGTWYYMNGSGAMHTGWLLLGNTWYYMNSGGAMVTGWQYIGGAWYLFNGSGAWIA